ncbi:discoidin domain-containing protein [Haloferula sp.]|uniref:discoidin domain-containing protein n=1 Tax=Haloferula sp. TaxID=2497595 RepID=UPI00329AE97B
MAEKVGEKEKRRKGMKKENANKPTIWSLLKSAGSVAKGLALIGSALPAVCFSADYAVSTQAEFDAVKNAALQPGDAILLERGQQFVGMLSPTGKGTAAAPIRIGAFGAGDRPLIDAQGLNEAGVLLEGDIAYWEVSGLEIINNDGTNNDDNYFFGILVVASGPDDAVYEHIHIEDNYIHHVNGAVEGKDRGGIHVYMEGLGNSIVDDLRITNNRIEDVGGVGIANKSSCGNVTVYGSGGYLAENLWTGVYIGGNYVSRTGRNSIIIRVSQDPMVEYNVVAHSSRHSQGNSIFCFDTVGCIMQYNEAYGNTVSGSSDSSNADRGGFDADYTCVDTYIQYNYSHDNEYFCAIMKKLHRNVVIRYNVTQDEKQGFYFYGFDNDTDVENVHIYNNTHYVSAGNNAAVFVQGRKPHATLLENNIFYFEDANNSSYGTGNLSGATFNNNIYYNITPHASDSNAIIGDPLFTSPGVVGTDIDLRTMGALRGYQLLAGSPAIDASSAISGTEDRDVVGYPILDGTADIGAFEYMGPVTQVTYDFLEGSVWDGGAGGGAIGAHASLTNVVTGESITLRTVDVIGQDGSKASDGVSIHRTNISGATYLGIDDQAGGVGGYGTEFRNFNPNEGWVFAFDEDVYLENIKLGSQNDDAELTLSSDVFDDMVLANGQPSDVHDLGYRFVPAGTELSLMMTTPTNGMDTGIGVTNITVSKAPLFTGPTTLLQAELNDDAIGVTTLSSSDVGGGEMVKFDTPSDEISYEVNVLVGGTYLVGFRVASDSGLVNLALAQDGTPLTTLDRMIEAGESWTTVYKMITLQAGNSTLTVSATDGEPQLLNWLELTASDGYFDSSTSTSPVNIALNQAASASNVHSSPYPANKAVDGDLATRWATKVTTPWLEIDFGSDVLVNGVSIDEYGEQIGAYEIQVYDAGNWETIFEGENPYDNQIKWFPLVVGAKFRLQIVESSGNPTIREFGLYGMSDFPASIERNTDAISLEWPNTPGTTYSVLHSTDLGADSWEAIESGIPALFETNSFTIEIPENPVGFYRIMAE